VQRRIRVAIDLRPLARGPATGIGLILSQTLEELGPRGFEFVGVSDLPLKGLETAGTMELCVSGARGGRIRWERGPLPQILRAIDPPPDLFHATWNHGVPSGLPFPSVLSLHDLIPWVAPRYVPWPRPALLHRWLYRRAVTGSAGNAAAIVTLSEASRRDIAERLPAVASKVEVVPCAVPRWFRPPSPEAIGAWRARFGAPYVLYFGGFDPRKGVEVLVEAMVRAFPEASGAPALVLAGAGTHLAARAAEARGLRVHLPGYVPDQDLPSLLGGAALFVYPSRYEGFGIPPLLAMAAGVPCAVSDIPAIREVVGNAGLFFPPGDVAALQAMLQAAVRNPGSLETVAARGPERAARFSVDSLAERMIRVYERAAGSRRGTA